MKKSSVNKKKIEVTISYNKKVAKKFHKTEYYASTAANIKSLPQREKEKSKLSTPRTQLVTDKINQFKEMDLKKTWKITLGIFKQRQKMANGTIPHRKAGQLMSLLTNPIFLATCYKNIRKKKGAMTEATMMPPKQLKTRKKDQVTYLRNIAKAPDNISYNLLEITGQLLKQGRYPWGISRRIFIPKPGTKDQLRPITIPPFMDKVIQEGIRVILESIYEPFFEKMNRSFGFRPNKGTHDAIYGLTRLSNTGMQIAIEGDIKAAYDKVNRQKLLEILKQEIEDQNFLKLIKTRLKYTYFDSLKEKCITEKEGIPQGGIDSPYLWNIYMLEFDKWIKKYMENLLLEKNKKMKTVINKETDEETTNEKPTKRYQKVDPYYNKIKETKRGLIKQIRELNSNDTDTIDKGKWKRMQEKAYEDIRTLTATKHTKKQIQKRISSEKKRIYRTRLEKNETNMRLIKYNLIKQVKRVLRKRQTVQSSKAKRRILRYYYTRYADDWIILGNYDIKIAEKIKKDIKDYLETNLYATLSVEKTLITDMKKEPAKFLGFQIYIRNTIRIRKVTRINKNKKKEIFYGRANNAIIICEPDKQRMLNRSFMKNFCDRKGRPREIPWLSPLDTISIIERFNACIRGLANFYAEWVTYPKTSLHRWLYILKYSCLKTLAKKYDTSITGIMKRFGVKTETQDTIIYKVTLSFPQKGNMTKEWRLITANEAINAAIELQRYNIIQRTFESIEYGTYLENYPYPNKPGRMPRVMNENFLEKIEWVSRRSLASMGMPCTLCGETENVEMHHIKHIRKTPYDKIKEPWQKLMSIRNRKQIPVCFNCHRYKIHTGEYTGQKLINMSPIITDENKGSKIRIFDGRTINIENYVQPGQEHHAKTLEEKGWSPYVE